MLLGPLVFVGLIIYCIIAVGNAGKKSIARVHEESDLPSDKSGFPEWLIFMGVALILIFFAAVGSGTLLLSLGG